MAATSDTTGPGPVLVVGAGPVGLTAALLLARRGLPVLVAERQPQPYPLPRAVHLDGEALRVLQDAGVAGDVAAAGRPLAGLRLVDGRLRTLAEFARDPAVRPHGWPQGLLFHQPDLERALRGAVAREPRIELAAGTALVALAEGCAVLRGRTERSVPVRAVLGCDGARSTVRELIGARLRDLGPADRWLVVDARARFAEPPWPGVHQVCDPRRAATFMPLPGGRYRWEFRLAAGETAEELTAGLDRLTAPFGARDVEVLRAAEYTFHARVADRWRAGRVLLAGDAAHLTPPFIGQGLGLGLRDVHQVAWKLAAVLAGAAGDDLLDTHQAEREPHARALIRVALLVGRLMTGGGQAGALVRRGVLAGARRLPAVAALATAGRTPPLPAGPLVDRRGPAGPRLAGALLPQPWVEAGGRRCRLDELLGPGWAEVRLAGGALAVRAQGGEWLPVADGGALAAWLRRGRASSVVVRPDRIVRSAEGAGRRPGDRMARTRGR